MTRMMLLRLVATLSAVLSIAASSEISTEHADRELQTNTIVNAACNFVSRILPGDFICECAITIGFLFECSFQDQICLGPDGTGYCATPSLEGDIRFLARTTTIRFCLENPNIEGDPARGICIDFDGLLNDEDASSFNLKQAVVKKAPSKFSSLWKSFVSSSPSLPSQASTLIDCAAMSDDDLRIPCNSCQLCDDNTGYMFDCSNINELLVQSNCTKLSLPTSLKNPNQDVEFFPNFDAM